MLKSTLKPYNFRQCVVRLIFSANRREAQSPVEPGAVPRPPFPPLQQLKSWGLNISGFGGVSTAVHM